MSAIAEKLSVREKVGYSLGDLAANLIFQTFITFLAFFYTDVFKIPAGTASAIIFWGGIIGGVIFNPIMGIIADRTNTRWGKFRPWVLWTAVPFGVFSLLAFTTPDLGEQGKVYYAMITYTLLVIIYAANNLPYAALSGVLTGSMSDRNSLSSYRFVAVMIAQFMIQVLLLPLVLMLGNGDQAIGFQKAMMFFAIVGTIFFVITFLTTKERIVPTAEQKSTVKEDLTDLFRNKPWILMLVITVLVFITLALKGGTYIFYFQNYVDKAALASFLDGIGFNGFIAGLNSLLSGIGLGEFHWPDDPVASGFGIFNGGGIIFMIVGIGFSKPLADRFGKRNVFGVALLVSTLFLLVFVLYPPDAIGLIFISQVLHGLFVRHHDSAAVGDDRRRCGLLGMEEQSPRDRDHLLGDDPWPEVRPCRGRISGRKTAGYLRLCARSCRTDSGNGQRHQARHQRLCFHSVPDLLRAVVLLRDQQGDGIAHRAGSGSAPQGLSTQGLPSTLTSEDLHHVERI